MDIYFFCGSCGQHLVVDEAGAGLVIPCPNCAKDLTVPGQALKPAPHPQPAGAPCAEKDQTVVLKWAPPPSSPNKEGKT